VVTRVAVFRVILQQLRLKKDQSEGAIESLIQHPMAVQLIVNAVFGSQDGITQACALQIVHLVQKNLLASKKDATYIKIDPMKLYEVFEKNM